MFTVKKVSKHEYVHQIVKVGKVTILSGSPKGWAVVDDNGVPVCRMNEMTGKPMFDVFNQKRVAQQLADWMNRNVDEIEMLEVKEAA